MRLILFALVVYVLYRLFIVPMISANQSFQNQKNAGDSKKDEDLEYTDYEEIDK